ncbi:hypothetical protein [Pectobacterium brasiliense]|uniref:hypothetical protein n=1 Tax=Pectobacterium brasiliense TaxID=180957 RepID=UPI00196919FE|nr:hypothetical protein [Pectobacterium brasiliense]MBN3123221.1 hypothetical protein [Pectobacterium brasiliense]
MALISTPLLKLTPEEETTIAALSDKLATNKPRKVNDERRLTDDQIVQIKRACVMGHSAKAIRDAFGVSIAYVMKQKRTYNPKKYQKIPMTLVEKSVLAKQMRADSLSATQMGELLGISSRTAAALADISSPGYLVDQMLPYDVVLSNLRCARYVENPVYKPDTRMWKVRLLVSSARQQIRHAIGLSRRK